MASQPPVKRPPPAPSNPVLLAAQEQWLFTSEELARSPSQLDGMSMDDESLHRSKGVNFIAQVGIMLKLPQPTIATAAVYLHRFFMRHAISDKPERQGVHAYPIAATSLFLATKVEENVRRMKELVVAVCRVAQKQPNLVVDEQSKEFWKWRDTILHHEDILLEALCFDLQLEQPYKILYDYICFFGVNDNKHIRNSSWAFLNDSMYTVLCLQYPARVIAAAAFYAAASHCDLAFEDDESGRPWWEQIDVDITQVRQACTRMAELYESNAQNKHNQFYPTIRPFNDGAEKTRIPRPGSALEAPDPPSRKRSREPESNIQDHKPKSQEEASQNGRRSPKRSRVGSFGGDGAPLPPLSSNSPSSPSFSQDRSSNGHPHQSQNRHQHPLPPAPRTSLPTRRNSGTKNVDPIQQRIDQIVSQNAATSPKQSPSKRVPESHSHSHGRNLSRDREREGEREDDDRHRHRDRRSSYSSATASRDQPPVPPPEHRQQPPPKPVPGDDEAGGSEEGEL